MSSTNVCPDRSCLQALLAGQLAQKEQEETVRHVETCVACQQNLDGLTSASRSWENLVPHLVKQQPEPAPVLKKVIAQAKVGTATDHTDAEDKSTPHREALPSEETQADPRPGPRDDDLAFLAPPTREDSIGRLAHYEILAIIGKGGFGTVLKAFDEKLHRMVAIKVLSPELSASGTARQRFIREARAAAAVTHEHLVTIHAVEEDHRPPYLVMQLVDGVTLQQKIDKAGTLQLKEILRIGLQMAAGLAAAHKQGLVHRDIKPTNVLLENGVERVKITDFGLARAVDDASVTQSGTVAGTPMYMSPEQAEGLPLDHRSDLFSLGTVLYVMCTGRPPFRATGTMAVLKRVTEDTPRPIRETNPEIPEWLANIIAKLHAKKPEERFQTAKEVAEVLGQYLADVQQGRAEGRKAPGEVPAAAAPSPVAHTPSSPSRTPSSLGTASLWFAIGGLVLPMCFVILMSVFLERNEAGLPLALCGILFAIGECVALACGIAGRRSAPGKVGLGLSIISLLLFLFTLGWQSTTPQMLRPVPGEDLLVMLDRSKYADPENQKDGDWVPLFNGKNLDSWRAVGGTPSTWTVENGVLRGGGSAGYLVSDRRYVDFQLRAEVRISPGADWGLLFRTDRVTAQANNRSLHGQGVEFIYNGPVNDVLGQIQIMVEPTRDGATLARLGHNLKPNAWLPLELTVQGDRFGVKVDLGSVGAGGLSPPFQAGPIILRLASDKSVLEFRKIEVKNLAGTTPPPPLGVAPFDEKKAKKHQDAWAKHLGAPVEFTNSIGMKLRLIPPGQCQMGSTADQIAAVKKAMQAEGESPVRDDWTRVVESERRGRLVKLTKPFRLGQYEVTAAQFRKFVEESKYKTDAERDGKGGQVANPKTGVYEFSADASWRKPGPFEALDDLPVLQVSWNDAKEFCGWLSQKEGRRYRLPTDAEWEYACRAGTYGLYSSGDNAFEHTKRIVALQPAPASVGSKNPNAFGLFDMEGNAWEWCADWAGAYDGAAVENPTGPAAGTHRIFRGGSFLNPQWACRPAIRLSDLPSARTFDTGFRVVLEMDPQARTEVPPKSPVAFSHGQAMPGWGEVIDANRDCQFASSKEELTITVPGGHHNLNPAAPFSNVAAPRVLRKASGDFDLQVSVPPFNRPGPNTASGSPNSYVGAGLLCWQDDNNFVRFFRAANGDSDRLIASLELFTKGQKLLWQDVDVPDSTTFLRVERRAVYFYFTYSADGVKWSEITVPRQKYLTDALELGVAATNSTTKTHIATFRKLEIKGLAAGETGWVQLFNGKDLTGWKTHLEQPGYWHVENGVLIGSGQRSHLFSERGDFKNFHLRVEAKINKGGNSGVLFRSEYGLGFDQKLVGGAGKLPLGYEVDLHAEADLLNPTGSVWRLGMRSGKPAAWDWKASSPNIQPDAWVTLEVIAEGTRIKTRVNGKTVLETADETDLFRMGHLALQVEKEGTVVHFRKIEIKELPATP